MEGGVSPALSPHSSDDGLISPTLARFRYRRQHLILDRARRGRWRTLLVNQTWGSELDFDRCLMVQFRGCVVTSDAGLLAYRELDDALGLSAVQVRHSPTRARARTATMHWSVCWRQSVFGRLAGYEDVNDAERLRHDPAMRWIVGGRAAQGRAASPSQMGRFETQWLAAPANLSLLFPTCPASGSISSMVVVHRCFLCSYGFEREPNARRAGG